MDAFQIQLERIDEIKTKIEELMGQTVQIRANITKSRTVEYPAKIKHAHRSFFVIEMEARRGRLVTQSFQYADVLMGIVQLFDDNGDAYFNFEFQDISED